jgi:hypothetical protein
MNNLFERGSRFRPFRIKDFFPNVKTYRVRMLMRTPQYVSIALYSDLRDRILKTEYPYEDINAAQELYNTARRFSDELRHQLSLQFTMDELSATNYVDSGRIKLSPQPIHRTVVFARNLYTRRVK